jgi:hypothetical protein
MPIWHDGLDKIAEIASNSLVVELATLGGGGMVLGAAAGWLVGLVARGTGHNVPGVTDSVGWGTGAGAFLGVMVIVFNRTLY